MDMNKFLLGTTTLVGAATLYAGAAFAEAPKVTLGGTINFEAGYVSDDQDGVRTGGLPGISERSQAFRNDTKVDVKVDGKGDNGLGYGALIELNSDVTPNAKDPTSTNARRTYIYMEGSWGRFELGSNVGSQSTMKIDASNIARATGGIDGDWFLFANNLNAARYLSSPDLPIGYGLNQDVTGFGVESQENINKVTYYTPRWSGFQIGLNYSPNDRDRGQTFSRADGGLGCSGATGSVCTTEDVFGGGINWEGKWDQVGLGVAVTGETANSENSLYEDLQAWNAGGWAGMAGFKIAGSYGDWGDSMRLKTDNADSSHYWTVGGSYEWGPFGVSVTYLTSEYDNGGATGHNDFDNVSVGADYKLAPGLTPYAEISFYDQDAVGSINDNSGTAFLIGSQLNF
jgi:predicted porin